MTQDIVSCPSNVHLIGCKWVYSIKLHSDGTVDRYKVRLVVLGNRQEYGLDYEEAFTPRKYVSSLFIRKTSTGSILLLVYVDDIFITGTDSSLITSLQQQLKDSFHMKYLDSSSVDTPLELNVKYRLEECDLLPDPTLFRQLVGSLNYLTITQPGIYFAVQYVSQFMQAPCYLHLVAVHHIIRYLLGTSTRGLFFRSDSPIHLKVFSDSDWAGCPVTRCSVTGWCIFLGESLIA
ncbi:uncharacterized mitochondrial protein AtMg00810-like [Solanum verrucosum]|uniref:uncharacterized mitochondrial protein AtMg00810-like n=1 Tax=Solanum verrucosum TaxID=315347 RepID=UPI0020D0A706|nr:uncharacterized mitochondrial protein AtMg00810-like [Solanum verrucosum]